MKRSFGKLCVLAVPVAALLLSLAPAGASAVGAECGTSAANSLANCVPVENTPWVPVPAINASTLAPGGPVAYAVACPSGSIGAGYDYVPGNPGPATLSVLVPIVPGFGLADLALFTAYNYLFVPVSFKPLLGCVRPPVTVGASPTRAAPRLRHIVRTVPLRASQRRTHHLRCPGGHALVASSSGVGFFTRRPPSLHTLRQLAIRHRQRNGVVETTVTTGPQVGDNERVVLQQHAVCRRR